MLPDAQNFTNKSSAKAQILARKKLSTGLMLCCLLGLGTLFVAMQLHAAEASVAKQNLYAKNYKEQNRYQLKSQSANPDTKMYVSNHKEDDNISMLEDGYDMMGSSGFKETDAPVEDALQYGKEIKADKVLVYRKYGSARKSGSKIELIKEAAKKGGEVDEKDMVEEPTEYQYYASYWAKLPMPLFGVHVIKLVKTASDDREVKIEEKGLKVIAVIKDSPAAKANIVKGDTLLKVGDIELVKADDLFAAVKRYAGQIVPVELQQSGTEIKTKVALNSRK
ncbi:MAG: PDZ domain-containing protein [Methylotenera sp.]|uniref:PDZ domain-containing protein n=1 Tax=Methylotenera sp. TaxID=2051956 RepID=UPI00272FF4C9|nr:PDZ domain-containing protein [Methylotenera sp.]MDP1523769.1 PDZ domain-containing protein [Methylotenera sp.]MDZ4212489.1 PDZ domain-containing protein [Methylotenera sp.]